MADTRNPASGPPGSRHGGRHGSGHPAEPGSSAELDELIDEMVSAEAPRLFAVVQVHATRLDGRVAAWGLAFEDHAEIVGADANTRISVVSPEHAIRRFGRSPDGTTRLVWVDATAPP
jgi:hypothetical protein